jgi:inhibitor of cysteine peptidase
MESIRKIVCFIGLMMVFCWGACAMAADINFSDPNKAIIVTAADSTFTLTLKANPSTGFSWFLAKYDQTIVEPISQKYYSTSTERVGVGGYEVWEFKIKPEALRVPQVIEVQMLYARPWEPVNSKPAIFSIFIKP